MNEQQDEPLRLQFIGQLSDSALDLLADMLLDKTEEGNQTDGKSKGLTDAQSLLDRSEPAG